MIEAPHDALPSLGSLVDGRWSTGAEAWHEHIYAATGTRTVDVPLARATEIDAAVEAARRASNAWRALRPDLRRQRLARAGELLAHHAERLAIVQTIESSIPLQVARQLPPFVAEHFAYFAGWADKLEGAVIPVWPTAAHDYALAEPYGVVGILLPWNAPLQVIAQAVAPALATGNTIVLKPSEKAPFSAALVGDLLLEAGIPPGVVNIVPSDAAGGELLAGHPGVDKVHFTGSATTARRVLAATQANLTPHCLELGGKSALVIFADADLLAAAQHAVGGAVTLAGQGCTNATRILIDASVYDRVMRLIAGLLRRVRVGDPLDEAVMMGPVVSAAACESILATVERAVAAGSGRLACGGERLGGDLGPGFFVAPTLFGEVSADSELAQREIFGPVLACSSFESEAEAIQLANGTAYGLAAYLHTSDLKRAHRVAAAMRTGNVWVNGLDVSPGQPFGGMRHSGYGRVGGRAALAEFTVTKNVWIAT